MSSTAPGTTNTQPDGVEEFARAVRTHLGDLKPEQIEELTEDLEDNLGEMLADSGALPASASAYAAELRESAGLGAKEDTRIRFKDRVAPIAAKIEESAAFRAATPVLKRLAPLWWILRGYGIYNLTVFVFGWVPFQTVPLPQRGMHWALLIAFIGASLLWGLWQDIRMKREEGRSRWERVVGRIAAAAAILGLLLLPFTTALAATFENIGSTYGSNSSLDLSNPELLNNGVPLTNVFAYDAEGKPIPQAQLFDQNGNPLNLGAARPPEQNYYGPIVGESGIPINGAPDLLSNGQTAYNVFPQRIVPDGVSPANINGVFGYAKDQLRTPSFPQPQVYGLDPSGVSPEGSVAHEVPPQPSEYPASPAPHTATETPAESTRTPTAP